MIFMLLVFSFVCLFFSVQLRAFSCNHMVESGYLWEKKTLNEWKTSKSGSITVSGSTRVTGRKEGILFFFFPRFVSFLRGALQRSINKQIRVCVNSSINFIHNNTLPNQCWGGEKRKKKIQSLDTDIKDTSQPASWKCYSNMCRDLILPLANQSLMSLENFKQVSDSA